ncbi:uncharacterized protein BJ171DRAFT_613804 [Polychytrium aggregatum]|uniref:uncharacterized protein n=1 Tax=Polychytrium aggregatum TaxID=110093 RepID=UPI0022FE56DE|nr:uncharacterized protein BJ171DRAFT_613804 [Polychytrium aggregatum]KAI9205819.1 hypothetical protein BJ171DRAFT_613804 [Polychytrium aggregatum]
MSAALPDQASDLAEKYKTLLQERSVLKAQNSVLKKALLEEQTNSKTLANQLKQKEEKLRQTTQELDLQQYHNDALAKRIENLRIEGQRPLSAVLPFRRSTPLSPKDSREIDVLSEELSNRIAESEQLHRKIADLTTINEQLEVQIAEMSTAYNGLLKESQIIDTENQKLKSTSLRLQSTLEESSTQATSFLDQYNSLQRLISTRLESLTIAFINAENCRKAQSRIMTASPDIANWCQALEEFTDKIHRYTSVFYQIYKPSSQVQPQWTKTSFKTWPEGLPALQIGLQIVHYANTAHHAAFSKHIRPNSWSSSILSCVGLICRTYESIIESVKLLGSAPLTMHTAIQKRIELSFIRLVYTTSDLSRYWRYYKSVDESSEFDIELILNSLMDPAGSVNIVELSEVATQSTSLTDIQAQIDVCEGGVRNLSRDWESLCIQNKELSLLAEHQSADMSSIKARLEVEQRGYIEAEREWEELRQTMATEISKYRSEIDALLSERKPKPLTESREMQTDNTTPPTPVLHQNEPLGAAHGGKSEINLLGPLARLKQLYQQLEVSEAKVIRLQHSQERQTLEPVAV